MTDPLSAFAERSLARPVPEFVRVVAGELATAPGARAVLFYGSNLRTRSADGVLDFYVLLGGPAERGIWPRVGYREFPDGQRCLRAKIATMNLATFARAAAGQSHDTTVWARFVQPAALVWSADAGEARAVISAIAAAAATAARFAAVLGPARGRAEDYWRALFRETYRAEFRVERQGRGDEIVAHDADRYAELLPLAWEAGGIAFRDEAGLLSPILSPSERARLRSNWARCRRAGKPLNIVRLLRAASTFEGAARYGAWKIERHTGVPVPLSPWAERHPVLAAPGVLWRVWRRARRG